MSSNPPRHEPVEVSVIARYRNSAAFDHGTTAFRQGQPLTDNPYHRTGQRDEWHAWNDGWALVRNAVEQERARAEWAEQACRDAMEAGLAACEKLRRTVAIYETMNRYSGLMDRLADDWHETRLLDTLAATCNERDALRVRVAMLEEQLTVRQRTLTDVNLALVDAMDRAEAAEERTETLHEALRRTLQELEHVQHALGKRATPGVAMDLERGIALARGALGCNQQLPPSGTPYIPASHQDEQDTRAERYDRLIEQLDKIDAEEAADPDPDGELLSNAEELPSELEAIVRAVAKSDPVELWHGGQYSVDSYSCVLCGYKSAACRREDVKHVDACPWLRAREYVTGEGSGPERTKAG